MLGMLAATEGVATILWIIAAILVIAGIVTLLRGGVIAGTSAGAAIMSATMFYDPPLEVMPVLKNGVVDGKDIAPGLGFIGTDVFVDQHLLARGRFAELILGGGSPTPPPPPTALPRPQRRTRKNGAKPVNGGKDMDDDDLAAEGA